MLEDSIKREFLSANYETMSEMLSSCEAVGSHVETSSSPEAVPVLPWIPWTTPAVALRLMELDVSIYYTPDQKAAHLKENRAGYFVKSPSMYSAFGSFTPGTSQAGCLRQDNCLADPVTGRTILKRGRGRPRGPSRTRGGKSQRITNCWQDSSNLTTTEYNEFTQLPRWEGRSRASGKTKKGRRSVESRQNPRTVGHVVGKGGGKGKIIFDDTSGLRQEEWNLVETEGAENASSSERSEFDNANGHASGDEYDDDDMLVEGFSGGIGSAKPNQYNGSVEYGFDREDDDVNYEDDYNYDEEGDNGMDERDDHYEEVYINSDHNEERNQPAGEERVEKVDGSSEGGLSTSSSFEFSY